MLKSDFQIKVSIVVPTYKRPDLLERLLISIERQTFQAFEIIVVDDNSPNVDEYADLVGRYKRRFREFTFLRNDRNSGAPYSRNRGICCAKYDLIALVDDDDEWLPLKLEKQVQIFENSASKLGLVYTWTDAIDESGAVVHKYRAVHEGSMRKKILSECFIPSPSVMLRKKAIEEAGYFDLDLPSCQDWDLWTRVAFLGYECKPLKEVVTLYHKHSRESIGLSDRAKEGYFRYHKKHYLRSIAMLEFKNIYVFFRLALAKLV